MMSKVAPLRKRPHVKFERVSFDHSEYSLHFSNYVDVLMSGYFYSRDAFTYIDLLNLMSKAAPVYLNLYTFEINFTDMNTGL